MLNFVDDFLPESDRCVQTLLTFRQGEEIHPSPPSLRRHVINTTLLQSGLCREKSKTGLSGRIKIQGDENKVVGGWSDCCVKWWEDRREGCWEGGEKMKEQSCFSPQANVFI